MSDLTNYTSFNEATSPDGCHVGSWMQTQSPHSTLTRLHKINDQVGAGRENERASITAAFRECLRLKVAAEETTEETLQSVKTLKPVQHEKQTVEFVSLSIYVSR